VNTELRQTQDGDARQQLGAGQYHAAFGQLVERYKGKVFHLALSILHNETEAQDMTQEIFLRIWKALPNYHGEASLSTWIYTISRNRCLTELKRERTHPTVSLNDEKMEPMFDHVVAIQTNGPEAGAELDVQWMLSQLPEKYRRVITLFYLEQKSYEDVAAMLGLPLGTVKTFLYRAKRELLKLSDRPMPTFAKPELRI
jgi:RNA polymerase sigma-70 factor (ECF subfamily)